MQRSNFINRTGHMSSSFAARPSICIIYGRTLSPRNVVWMNSHSQTTSCSWNLQIWLANISTREITVSVSDWPFLSHPPSFCISRRKRYNSNTNVFILAHRSFARRLLLVCYRFNASDDPTFNSFFCVYSWRIKHETRNRYRKMKMEKLLFSALFPISTIRSSVSFQTRCYL